MTHVINDNLLDNGLGPPIIVLRESIETTNKSADTRFVMKISAASDLGNPELRPSVAGQVSGKFTSMEETHDGRFKNWLEES